MNFLRPLILSVVVLLFWQAAGAKVFWVTSNADYGENTLRGALDSAYNNSNDSFETDYIYFKLQNSREIEIKYILPRLSSNLVIDASTQPGNSFGAGGTKVTLSYKAVSSGQWLENDPIQDASFISHKSSLF